VTNGRSLPVDGWHPADTATERVTMLSWIVGVPFWAGVVVGVLATLLVTAIF
jgi:hypothetical protein